MQPRTGSARQRQSLLPHGARISCSRRRTATSKGVATPRISRVSSARAQGAVACGRAGHARYNPPHLPAPPPPTPTPAGRRGPRGAPPPPRRAARGDGGVDARALGLPRVAAVLRAHRLLQPVWPGHPGVHHPGSHQLSSHLGWVCRPGRSRAGLHAWCWWARAGAGAGRVGSEHSRPASTSLAHTPLCCCREHAQVWAALQPSHLCAQGGDPRGQPAARALLAVAAGVHALRAGHREAGAAGERCAQGALAPCVRKTVPPPAQPPPARARAPDPPSPPPPTTPAPPTSACVQLLRAELKASAGYRKKGLAYSTAKRRASANALITENFVLLLNFVNTSAVLVGPSGARAGGRGRGGRAGRRRARAPMVAEHSPALLSCRHRVMQPSCTTPGPSRCLGLR